MSSAVALPRVPPPIRESKIRHALRVARYRILESASLSSHLVPRRFHAFNLCVGKSGSHSVYGIFQAHYRAAHEPYAQIVLDANEAQRAGKISAAEKHAFLLRRDRALWLELEASPFLIMNVRELVELFPDAKFILTLRDCYSWLNSTINFSLATRTTVRHASQRTAIFGNPQYTYSPAEELLRECGLFTLDGYLKFWATHNQNALDAIPPAHRIVIRTSELASSVGRIADFLDISPQTLDATQAHRFRTGADYGILQRLDRSFLEHKIQTHCRVLMSEYFSHIHCLEDALP